MKQRGRSAVILFAFLGIVPIQDNVIAGNDMYGYIGPDGTFEITNVPVDERFRPAGAQVRRLQRRASAEEVEEAIGRYSWRYNLHPALLLAVIKAESDFKPTVISRSGAVGLMQLIPETAIRHGVENLYDTDDNIRGGARHLRYLLDRFNGNIRLAVAAYNAGEHRVERYRAIPPYQETREYVQKVMIYYKSFRGNYQHSPERAVRLAIEHRPLQHHEYAATVRYGATVFPTTR
jgi:soluble lytic murein transglycosylase